MHRNFKVAWPETAVGLGVIVIAVVVGWGTAAIPASTYSRVGPAVVPWMVTAALAVLGVALTLVGLAGGWVAPDDEGRTDRRALGWLIAGLALNVVLIDSVAITGVPVVPSMGFIVASTVLFTLTARAFGSLSPARDAGIGLLLATVAYIGFDRVLGYRIGSGLIERLL